MQRFSTLALIVGTVFYPMMASSQDPSFKFEITPFAAYRFGGTLEQKDGPGRFDVENSDAQGIILDIAARIGGHWEILYMRQDTRVGTSGVLPSIASLELDIEHLQFGGSYSFEGESTQPFLSLTLGISRLEPNPLGSGAEIYPSVSIGGGFRFRADKRIGVRVEGRVLTTLVDNDSRILCVSSGGAACAIQIQGTPLTQWEARAGLVFRF